MAKQKNKSKLTEQQKLVDFLLSKGNTTVIVDTGEKDAEKKFLGYEFSNRRGQEGLHEYDEGSMLFNKNEDNSIDLNDDPEKVNYYIREAFRGKKADEITVAECLQNNVRITTQDNLFDFSKGNRINVHPKLKFESKYEMEYLEKLVKLERGVTYDKKDISRNEKGNFVLSVGSINRDNIQLHADGELVDKDFDETKKLKKNDIFMALSGSLVPSIGKILYISEDTEYYAGGFMGILRPLPNNNCLNQYIAYLMGSTTGTGILRSYCSDKTSTMSNLGEDDIYGTRIPLPPLSIQESIVKECLEIDNSVLKAINDIKIYQNELNHLMENIEGDKKLLQNVATYSTDRTKIIDRTKFVTTDNLLQNKRGAVFPYEKSIKMDSAVRYFTGDILISNIRPYLKKIWLADRDGMCSPDVLVIHPNGINPKYLYASLWNDAFFSHVMSGVTGLKMPRGDKMQIMTYPITEASPELQRQIGDKCFEYILKIEKNQTIIDNAKVIKDNILEKYLK